MKNKNGFTLVELLAVIAILAILVVMLLPNIIDLFQESKEGAFKIEVQQIMKQAEAQWLLDMGGEQTYYNCFNQNDGDRELPLKGAEYHYVLTINPEGKFTNVSISNDEYAISNQAETGDIKDAITVLDIEESIIYGANINGESTAYAARRAHSINSICPESK